MDIMNDAFTMGTLTLIARFARALEGEPDQSINDFMGRTFPEKSHSTPITRIDRVEKGLKRVLFPRLLLDVKGPKGENIVVTTWHQAVRGDGTNGADIQYLKFKRFPGLTPDGHAWAAYCTMVESQFILTQGLLQQTHGHVGIQPFGRQPTGPLLIRGEHPRLQRLFIMQEKAAAMRHVADLVENGEDVGPERLAALLAESSEARKTRLFKDGIAGLDDGINENPDT